ncbi:hypothetical protein G0U57_012991, partial [Chelydra serpentina]
KKAGWCAFYGVRDILQGKINKTTRANLFNSTVLPAMIYGNETWSLIKIEEHQLSVTQRVMERTLLCISLRNHIPNEQLGSSLECETLKAGSVKCVERDMWPDSVTADGPQLYPSGIRENGNGHPVGLQRGGMTS